MKNIITLVLILIGTVLQSQEISGYASVGKSGLIFSLIEGDSKLDFGGNYGFGYTHNLNNNWGVLTGLEIGFYGNNISLNNYKKNQYLIDDRGSAFEYRTAIDSYEENSSFVSVNIPLMVQYKIDLSTPLYLNLGGKVFLPGERKTEIKATNARLSGYYPNKNLWIDDLPKHGFGKLSELNTDKRDKLKTTFSLSTEFGAIIKLNEVSKLYVGGYVDYGFTEVRKTKSIKSTGKSVVEYSSKGLDNTNLNTSLEALSTDGFTNIFAYGIQFRCAFEFKKKEMKFTETKI